MFHSIRWRLVASYVLVTLLAVSVVGVLALEIIRRHVRQQEIGDLRANAQAVARQALPLLQPIPLEYELVQLARASSFLGNVRVRILDEDERLLADSGPPGAISELLWVAPPAVQALQPEEGGKPFPYNLMILGTWEAWSKSLPQVDPLLEQQLPPGASLTIVRKISKAWGDRITFLSPRHSNWQPSPEPALEPLAAPRSANVVREPIGERGDLNGYVELSGGPNFGAEALAATRRALLLAGAGATLLAGLVGLWISHRLTRPLRSLQETAGRMGRGDLSARAPLRSRDEFGALADQFNQMADQLEGSFRQLAAERDALRRFVSDASHELRTPITALKSFITLLQGPAREDPAIQAEFLAESQAQLGRLEWITQNLLDLSRLDAGLLEMEFANHDVGEMLASAAHSFRPAAEEKGLVLRLALPAEPLQLRCDRARLEMALSNLLDNAVKFTPSGGQIEVGASRSEGAVRLWVSDTGIGIPPEDLPHVFERFYRSRNHGAPGSGLGLSIVERIVQAQGGRIYAESEPGRGARFTLEWIAAG